MAFFRVVTRVLNTLQADSGANREGSAGKFKTKVACRILDELERLGRLFRNPDRRRGDSVSSGEACDLLMLSTINLLFSDMAAVLALHLVYHHTKILEREPMWCCHL